MLLLLLVLRLCSCMADVLLLLFRTLHAAHLVHGRGASCARWLTDGMHRPSNPGCTTRCPALPQKADDHHAVVLLDGDMVSVDVWQLANWPVRWQRAEQQMQVWGAGRPFSDLIRQEVCGGSLEQLAIHL